jgi:hypothetical protein
MMDLGVKMQLITLQQVRYFLALSESNGGQDENL